MEKDDFHSAADLATSEQQRLTKGNNINISSSGVSKPQPDSVAISLPQQAIMTALNASTSSTAVPTTSKASPRKAPSPQSGSPGSRDYVGLAQQQQQQLQHSYGPSRPKFFKQFYNPPKKNNNNGSSSGSSSASKNKDIEADNGDDFDFGPSAGNSGGGGGNSFKLTPRKTAIDKKTTDEELRPLSNGFVLQNS